MMKYLKLTITRRLFLIIALAVLGALNLFANTATLTWPPITDAISYNIYKSMTSGSYSGTPFANVLDSQRNGQGQVYFIDSAVQNNKPYYYIVTTVSAGGESGYSNEVVARPVARKHRFFFF